MYASVLQNQNIIRIWPLKYADHGMVSLFSPFESCNISRGISSTCMFHTTQKIILPIYYYIYILSTCEQDLSGYICANLWLCEQRYHVYCIWLWERKKPVMVSNFFLIIILLIPFCIHKFLKFLILARIYF